MRQVSSEPNYEFNHPSCIWKKNYLKNCLELVSYAGDPGNVSTLVTLVDATLVSDAAHKLESVLEFEEDAGIGKQKGKQKRAFITGLGNRVRAYTNTKQPQLMEQSKIRQYHLNQAPGPGTPKMSLATFCTKKQKSSEL